MDGAPIAWLAAALLLPATAPGRATASESGTVRYEIAPDFEARAWSVRATFPHPQAGDLEFWMARWTAGAYHLAEYGSFVEELAASGPDGTALPVTRDGDSRFVVAAGAADPVAISYRAAACAPGDLNANMILDVEGSRITGEYLFVSPNSLLGFAREAVDLPCTVAIELPTGWRAECALPEAEGGGFAAPSWWRLEDSPILASPSHATVPFEVDGVPHELTLFGADEARATELAGRCRRLVEAGRDWMQGLPYPRYQFLVLMLPGAGAGLEHSESTLIVCDPAMEPGEVDHLLAHEYFHAWCAERIHVDALERPDYTRPLRTGTIWVNEGITDYFCRHLMVSAGLISRDEFFADLLEQGVQARMMAGFAARRSWTDVSRAAADWSSLADLLAFSVKHYQGGSVTIFALDLEMRRASGGERGVADLLRWLQHAFAARGRGFGEDELRAIVAGVAQTDLDGFFDRHIDGFRLPDLGSRLEVIGCRLDADSGRIVPLADATDAQRKALEDLFTPPPSAK
jgi:predicted metalloprotease with PDZ domain